MLKERQEASVQGLAETLGVATASVRRDLRELEAENRINRRHGRAIYRPTLVSLAPAAEEDESLEGELLEELIDETTEILSEARNLFLAGGPVLLAVAKKLSGKTIATHDLAIAMAAASGGNDITMIGREVDNETLTLRSNNLEGELSGFVFDAVVIEADGIDERNIWVRRKNHGLLPALESRSDSFVAIAKSTTIGRKGDRVAAPLGRADVVVLDRGASAEARQSLAEASVELRVAGEGDQLPVGFDQIGNVFVMKRTGDRFGGGASAGDASDE